MHRWLATAIVALVAASHTSRAADPQAVAGDGSSIVYVARNFDAINDFVTRPHVVQRMVDRLVMAVTGKSNVADAWRTLVNPKDIVGIKVSTDGGSLFSTHPSVVAAIADGLRKAGVSAENIIVWDRDTVALARAGYRLGQGYTMRPVAPVTGYDREAQVSSAMLGKLIWGDRDFRSRTNIGITGTYESEQLSTVSYLNGVLSRDVTKVVNVPTMSTTNTVGVAGCLYNMTVRNLDNWRRFSAPPSFGDPYLAELYFDERIGGKVVLNIMDGLIAQYAGGPSFEPNYAFHHASIYASKDPVAIDSIAAGRIDSWRATVRLPPLKERVEFLKTAELYSLGHSDPGAIELRVIPR